MGGTSALGLKHQDCFEQVDPLRISKFSQYCILFSDCRIVFIYIYK